MSNSVLLSIKGANCISKKGRNENLKKESKIRQDIELLVKNLNDEYFNNTPSYQLVYQKKLSNFEMYKNTQGRI